MQKVIQCLILSERNYSIFCVFCNQVLLILIVDEVKNFAANNLLQVAGVSHVLGSVQKGGIHILKNSEVLKRQKVSTVSLFMGIVEFRDKGFVLDLKLFFTIVNCFLKRFPPRFFTVKLVCFIGFPGSSYLVLFIFSLHDFDMILMFIYFNKFYS